MEIVPALFVSRPCKEIGNLSIVRIQIAKTPRISWKHDGNCLQFVGTCAILLLGQREIQLITER